MQDGKKGDAGLIFAYISLGHVGLGRNPMVLGIGSGSGRCSSLARSWREEGDAADVQAPAVSEIEKERARPLLRRVTRPAH
jgi:hypothetical protein